MKSKIIFKSMFIVVLFVILVCLVLIINDKSVKMAYDENSLVFNAYTIYYDNEGKTCMNNEELFYKDDKYTYSLPCISSYDTYLIWFDGTKELVKNALQNKKVDINSLVSHGLKVKRNEI